MFEEEASLASDFIRTKLWLPLSDVEACAESRFEVAKTGSRFCKRVYRFYHLKVKLMWKGLTVALGLKVVQRAGIGSR